MSRLFEEIDGIVKNTLDMMDQFDGPYETIPRPDPTPPPQQPGKTAKAADSEPVDADDNIDLFGDDEPPINRLRPTPTSTFLTMTIRLINQLPRMTQ